MSSRYPNNTNIQKGIRCMYSSNDQSHQSITGYGRILCRLKNYCHGTFNEIKWKRHYAIKLLTSQQLKLHIKSSWKCVLEQFKKHCNHYDLLPENHSAYRKHYSCETSLLRRTNDILWNMENKLVTSVTLLDLSATFDTVDHGILLEILHNKFGVDGNVLEWYSYYLKPRKFKVSINKAYSTEKTMQFSVPQESVQWAFLFIAYTSTLPEVIKFLTLSSFANAHSLRKVFSPSTKPMMKTTPLQPLKKQC